MADSVCETFDRKWLGQLLTFVSVDDGLMFRL